MAGAELSLPQKINETESFALGGACHPTRLASLVAVLTASAISGALSLPFRPNVPGTVRRNFGWYRTRSQRIPCGLSKKLAMY